MMTIVTTTSNDINHVFTRKKVNFENIYSSKIMCHFIDFLKSQYFDNIFHWKN